MIIKKNRKGTILILLGLFAFVSTPGFGQETTVNKETPVSEPIKIGGADIYLPKAPKGFLAKFKAKRTLKYHKKGDTNTIIYNGLTIKYLDQTVVKFGQSIFPAKIYTYNGRTELVLDHAIVTGSDGNDKVVVYCTNSQLDFTDGGVDTIYLTKKIALDIDGHQTLGNSVTPGERDILFDNIDYTYNGVTIMSNTDTYSIEDGEIVVKNSEREYYDNEVEFKTVRIKKRKIYLDEDEWDSDYEEEE